VIVNIDAVAFGGDGVGRLDNFVVFVPFSAPGDQLEIEITRIKKKFAHGRILRMIRASSQRSKPLCAYYEQCGGCCYQHLNYKDQLAIKKKQVEDAFRRIGRISHPPVGDVIGSPMMYHYRGKARYHAETVSRKIKIGFLDTSGGRLIDIENCAIMEETINEKLHVLRENIKLRERELTIWSGPSSSGPTAGGSIERTVKGKRFLVPRDGFFQANLFLTERLVDEACRLAAVGEHRNIVDAYCGSGLFSVFLSPFAEKVTGVEISENAVEHARINAQHLGAENIEFICSGFEDALHKKLLPAGNETDLMVLDPPRTGCEATILRAVADWAPKKIIYISCNPATQARDVKFFQDCGYKLQSLLPLDMFPQTEHLEVIGLLERNY
jgi:tRNA/tmRNA/rRNA uracil-C5-methylase (TrmA/RlmC/RlmD family)